MRAIEIAKKKKKLEEKKERCTRFLDDILHLYRIILFITGKKDAGNERGGKKRRAHLASMLSGNGPFPGLSKRLNTGAEVQKPEWRY